MDVQALDPFAGASDFTPPASNCDWLAGRRGTRRAAEQRHVRLEREAGAAAEVSGRDALSGEVAAAAAAAGDTGRRALRGGSPFRGGRGSRSHFRGLPVGWVIFSSEIFWLQAMCRPMPRQTEEGKNSIPYSIALV